MSNVHALKHLKRSVGGCNAVSLPCCGISQLLVNISISPIGLLFSRNNAHTRKMTGYNVSCTLEQITFLGRYDTTQMQELLSGRSGCAFAGGVTSSLGRPLWGYQYQSHVAQALHYSQKSHVNACKMRKAPSAEVCCQGNQISILYCIIGLRS